MPPHRLAAKAAAKAGRVAARAAEEFWRGVAGAEVSDAKIAARIKREPETMVEDPSARLDAVAAKPRWPHGAGGAAFADGLVRRFGLLSAADRAEADAACAGRFRLPGGRLADFGDPIAWRRDPVSGYEHPPVYWKRVEETRENVDILNTWWPGSFYHLIPLGKAHLDAQRRGDRAGAAKYARAFEAHLDGFWADNPPGVGPNWRSTTIVALRLVHLLWAQALFFGRADKDPAFCRRLLKSVYLHAAHIRRNLEWFPVRTNHYLANLYALYVMAALYPEFREAASWRRFALRELADEVGHHLRPDGVTHEGSTGYHRFVVEIFLSAVLQADALGEGETFGWAARDRLSRALDFLVAARRPDGAPPKVGDAADIRLQHLDQRDVLADIAPLLQIGAVALDRPDLKAEAPALSEYAFWLFGPLGAAAFDALTPEARGAPDPGAPAAFVHGGFAFHHAPGRSWLMFRAGPLALGGVAGHGHYDQLSFELWIGDEALLIDPGWASYEGDRAAFAYFKSTAAHNTVLVDGRDQIDMDLFIHPPPPRPTPELCAVAATEEGGACFEGAHALYEHLDDPVSHRRRLTIAPASRRLVIDDALTARGRHDLAWRFHFAPAVALEPGDHGSIRFRTPKGRAGVVACAEGAGPAPQVRLAQGWCAPRYGQRAQTLIASFEATTTGDAERRFVISWEDVAAGRQGAPP